VSPLSILPNIAAELKEKSRGLGEAAVFTSIFDDVSKLSLSEKDLKNQTLDEFLDRADKEFAQTGKVWYRE